MKKENEIKFTIYNNGNLALAEEPVFTANVSVPIKKERSNYTSRGVRKPTPADPIRDAKDLELISAELKRVNRSQSELLCARNYAIFILGITTGLRISDILKLKFRDILDFKGNMKETIIICEQKTGKMNQKQIVGKAHTAITDYLKELNKVLHVRRENISLNDYLWVSIKGKYDIKIHNDKPVDITLIYRMLQKSADKAGIGNRIHISTHTLRKTFGYWYYTKSTDKMDALVCLQQEFNHSSPQMTLTYIGISEEMKKQNLNSLVNAFDEINF